MNHQDNNKPKLRFPEFSDRWEVKRLGEVAEKIFSGKSTDKEIEGNYHFYGSTGIIGYTNNYDYSGKVILIARVGANAGALYVVEGNFSVSDNTLILKCYDTENIDFIYSYLVQKDLNKLVFGSGQPLVTGGQLKLLEISFQPYTNNKK